MEYNLGDLWMLAGTGVFAPVDDPSSSEPTFDPLGTLKEFQNGRIVKSSDAESLTDWNALELIASGRDSAQIVNGSWVNGGSSLEADQGDGGWAGLSHGHLALQAEGAEVFYRSLEVRPLVYLAPPADAVVLFDGSNADAWMGPDGGAQGWIVDGGVLQVVPFAGDLRTLETYGDVRLHLEFQVPATPTSEAHEDRGNSGVYLQGRYEVQILDSFGLDAGPVDLRGGVRGEPSGGERGVPAGHLAELRHRVPRSDLGWRDEGGAGADDRGVERLGGAAGDRGPRADAAGDSGGARARADPAAGPLEQGALPQHLAPAASAGGVRRRREWRARRRGGWWGRRHGRRSGRRLKGSSLHEVAWIASVG